MNGLRNCDERGVDTIIFRVGIGEHDANMRKTILNGMTWFSSEIADEKNKGRGEQRVISTDESTVKVLLIRIC